VYTAAMQCRYRRATGALDLAPTITKQEVLPQPQIWRLVQFYAMTIYTPTFADTDYAYLQREGQAKFIWD